MNKWLASLLVLVLISTSFTPVAASPTDPVKIENWITKFHKNDTISTNWRQDYVLSDMDAAGNTYLVGTPEGIYPYPTVTIKISPQGEVLWKNYYGNIFPPSEGRWPQHLEFIVDDTGNMATLFSDTYSRACSFSILRYDPAGQSLGEICHPGTGAQLPPPYYGGLASDQQYFYATAGEGYITAKYDLNNQLVWEQSTPGRGKANDLVLDGLGNMYVVGDGFYIQKRAISGELLWERQYTTTQMTEPLALQATVGVSGTLYVIGATVHTYNDFSSFVLLKYFPDGSLAWSKSIPGVVPPVIKSDAQGRLFLSQFITITPSNRANLAEVNPLDGSFIWSKPYPAHRETQMMDNFSIHGNAIYVATATGAWEFSKAGDVQLIWNSPAVNAWYFYPINAMSDSLGRVVMVGLDSFDYVTTIQFPSQPQIAAEATLDFVPLEGNPEHEQTTVCVKVTFDVGSLELPYYYPANFTYYTMDGTAKAGVDYESVSGTYSYEDFSTGNGKICIALIPNNTNRQGNRTFTFNLSLPNNLLLANQSVPITIIEDDRNQKQWHKAYFATYWSTNTTIVDLTADRDSNVYTLLYDFHPMENRGLKFAYIRTYDASGNIRWEANLGQILMEDLNVGPDGNLVMAGGNTSPYITPAVKSLIRKLNPRGELLWEKIYVPPKYESAVIKRLIQDVDGNIYAAGPACQTVSGQSKCRQFVYKFTPNGDLLWYQIYTTGRSNLGLTQNLLLDSQGYLIVPALESENNVNYTSFLRIDPAGNLMWRRDYPGRSLIQTSPDQSLYVADTELSVIRKYSLDLSEIWHTWALPFIPMDMAVNQYSELFVVSSYYEDPVLVYAFKPGVPEYWWKWGYKIPYPNSQSGVMQREVSVDSQGRPVVLANTPVFAYGSKQPVTYLFTLSRDGVPASDEVLWDSPGEISSKSMALETGPDGFTYIMYNTEAVYTVKYGAPANPTSVTISDALYREEKSTALSPSGGTMDFVVQLNQPLDHAIQIGYRTAPGSAGPDDFTPISSTLTIPANTVMATIAIPILGDAIPEPVENFFLELFNLPEEIAAKHHVARGVIQDQQYTRLLFLPFTMQPPLPFQP